MADELSITERALLPTDLEELKPEPSTPCLFPGCPRLAGRSDQLCEAHSRFQLSFKGKLKLAKQRLEENVREFAEDIVVGSRNASAKGDTKPAQWALEHLRVVEPIQKDDGGPRTIVVIGAQLPGLPLPAVTVIEQKRGGS
jgi:hypothetical protein